MYTIGEAARRSGVTPELLRAWERRYSVVAPVRTQSGYRLYDDIAIHRLRAMRTLLDEGWTASAAAASVRETPDAELPTPAPPETRFGDESSDLPQRFVRAAAAMNARTVEQIVDEMMTRASFEVAVEEYVFPALRALGSAWESGEVSVAAEHAASAAVHRRLGAAFDAAGRSPVDARPVLIGLPPGAHHELGALAFAVAARRAGLPVRYLGPDLPADDWVRALDQTDAIAAVIAVPTEADVDAARSVARQLHGTRRDLVIAFGGSGARSLAVGELLPGGLAAAADSLRRLIAR